MRLSIKKIKPKKFFCSTIFILIFIISLTILLVVPLSNSYAMGIYYARSNATWGTIDKIQLNPDMTVVCYSTDLSLNGTYSVLSNSEQIVYEITISTLGTTRFCLEENSLRNTYIDGVIYDKK